MNLLGKRRSKSLLFDILQEEPSLLQRIDQLQIQLKNRLKRRALEKHSRLEHILGAWDTEKPAVYGEPSLEETRAMVQRLTRDYRFEDRHHSQGAALA